MYDRLPIIVEKTFQTFKFFTQNHLQTDTR